MGRGIVLGLAAGLLVGWLLFHQEEQARRVLSPVAGNTAAPNAAPGNGAPTSTVAATWDREKFAPDASTGLSIRHAASKASYTMDGQVLTTRPLATIDRALAAARAEKNWPEFFAGILELVLHDSAEADRRLVALMADESLRLSGNSIGERFWEGLKDSSADGIAASARARARLELEDKAASRWRGRGFLSLIARYGTPDDIAWLETLADDPIRAMEVDRALALGSRNEAAAARLQQRLLKGRTLMSPWALFARENPDKAFETAEMLLAREGREAQAYDMLGAATRPHNAQRACALFLEIQDDRSRLRAMRSVQSMYSNEVDITGLEPLMETPRAVIEAVLAGDGDADLLDLAIGVVKENEVAQTDGNLAALRALAQQATGKHAKYGARAAKALAKIEKKRAGASGWEPERR